jgi:hypothetical protein
MADPAADITRLNTERQARPQPVAGPAERILQLEADIRALAQENEIQFHLVNEVRRVIAYRQAFLIRDPAAPRVSAISSMSMVDRNAPLVLWIESVVRALARDRSPARQAEFSLPAYGDADPEQAAEYPFPNFLWVPLADRSGKTFAGILLAREKPWRESEIAIAGRIADTYAHAWTALSGKTGRVRTKRAWLRRLWPVAVLAAVAAGFIPVPLTTLAPAEIVADDPEIVAAPLSGVIDRVEVAPNAPVKSGDVLFRFVDTELRNDYQVAEQALLVAQANVRKATQTSFVDPRAKRDLAVAEAELALAQARRDYARELLDRSVVTARDDGLAIYSDPDDWSGRPVTTGERVLEIADPSRIEVRIELAVDDSIALSEGARVRLFLDADPLNAIEARVVRAAYHAEPTPDRRLAYRVDARLTDDSIQRIGLRGTAQLYGEKVPLYFYLLRRPISALRQSTGF